MNTVEKTLEIIESILKHTDGADLRDIANTTGLNPSTVHRVSSILVKRGYLAHSNKRGKYFPGSKLLQISGALDRHTYIKERSFPFLKKLCDDISETVNMTILDGVEHVGIIVIPPKYALQVVPGVGNRRPLHCTSNGKIFLAYMPDERIDHIVSVLGLTPYTEKTITDFSQLKKEIETIRRDGVAFDDEEFEAGIRSAAAPIKGENGNVLAAISFIGPSVRISSLKMRQLAPMVRSCALEISRSLGYKGE